MRTEQQMYEAMAEIIAEMRQETDTTASGAPDEADMSLAMALVQTAWTLDLAEYFNRLLGVRLVMRSLQPELRRLVLQLLGARAFAAYVAQESE